MTFIVLVSRLSCGSCACYQIQLEKVGRFKPVLVLVVACDFHDAIFMWSGIYCLSHDS